MQRYYFILNKKIILLYLLKIYFYAISKENKRATENGSQGQKSAGYRNGKSYKGKRIKTTIY